MKSHVQRFGLLAAAAVTTLGVSACNFEVTNPGPIPDELLNDPTASTPLVNGMQRSVGDAIDWVLYWGAAVTFEINPAGSTGSYGIPPNIQNGSIDPDDSSPRWNEAQQARWVAESGLLRFAEVYDQATYDKTLVVARAYLWAGYANRLLGENFCDAVFDGGPLEPHTNYFTRSEQHLTDAIRVGTAVGGTNGTAVVNAATAARASVRASLATFTGNGSNAASLAKWAEAAADAAAITSNTYAFQMPYSNQDLNQYNHIMWGGSATAVGLGSPYRAHTVWGTYYEDYYTQTADSRVPFVIARNSAGALIRGDANVGRFGTNCTKTIGTQALCSSNLRVPFLPQAKFTAQNTPINLSSGWEMRLIQAEEALVRGDFGQAAGFMNTRRTALGLGNVNPANLTDGWTALKSERGLELWLEGRRLGDLRRWAAAGTPGTIYDGAYFLQSGVLTRTETTATRSQCFPIGRAETETNPNLRP